MANLPASMRWLFWDAAFEELEPERDADYLLPRILEHGGLSEVRWAIARFGMDRIHRFFREVGHPELHDRTIGFWRAALKAENEEWASSPAWRRSSAAPWNA